MGRHGYVDCDYYDELDCLRAEGYRQAVNMAIGGKRGQVFLKELASVLDSMPEKKLCEHDLVREDGMVCALGAVGQARGDRDMSTINPEAIEQLADMFNIAPSLVREIEYKNDDDIFHNTSWYQTKTNDAGEPINSKGYTEEEWEDYQNTLRWSRVREWVRGNIHD